MEKISPATKLREAAQLRIQQLFGSAFAETGESLPSNVRDGIARIINGRHKTFRYMLMTGLLVAVSDHNLNPRCLQMNAGCAGAYDARSLCQNVIVPFEKTYLQGRLGASNEPFANKTARADMIDNRIHVRKGVDTVLLETICEVLETVRLGDASLRKTAFVYALSVVLKRPANTATILETEPIESSLLDTNAFFAFFEAHTKGVSAVAVLASFFRMFYEKGTKVTVHPATESGASSKEVGDIDLVFKDGRRYAVEVKDKIFTPVDVSHACEKALEAGVHKVVFAVGHAAENWLEAVHEKLMQGVDLSRTKVPAFIRRITVSEAATLQGFPRDFVFCGSQCERYRQIGNSVPPPFAEHVARAVLKAMSKS